ncbi:MAG: c-type cytochrome [Methylococcaceae bacterium]|nr:c-type cytochrome [Methylococcaceae bacterium]
MKKSLFIKGFSLIIFCLASNSAIADNDSTKPRLAAGYGILEFTAPKAGTYQLSVLGKAGNGDILSSENQPKKLLDLMGDKLVLLSFIYATCSDVNGCPLATSVLYKIKKRLLKEPEIAKQLRLLTLSFNPLHDTPEKMLAYSKGLQGKNLQWQFLTTKSETELQPILQHYKQNIQKVYDEQGNFTGTFSHILRVYLIDKNKDIRNIYSVDFLHADTLINDIKTLLLKTPPKAKVKKEITQNLYSAGDNKTNYQNSDYKTQSVSLEQRRGKEADLLKNSLQPPLGLPKITFPVDNPLTKEKIALGRKLFYDRRLSINNTFSCAMCHVPEQGFSNNEMATSVGVEGRTVKRNAPTLYNVAYMEKLFHDGRENTLEQQAWSPLLAHNEMANPSIGYVIDKINHSPDYKDLFQQAFKGNASMETIGMALASYQRTLNSANSPFDRWFYGKQKNVLSEEAKRGYRLFIGKAACGNCHRINEGYALFTDQQLHNTGLGYQQAMTKMPTTQKVQVAAGVFIDVPNSIIETVAEPKAADLGLYEVTQNPADRWKYKTPSLRNISLTAPYMHNGQFQSLEDVIAFYNKGGIANENLSSLIKPLNLSTKEQQDLIAFLKSLTGDNVNELLDDAFAAPIGENK